MLLKSTLPLLLASLCVLFLAIPLGVALAEPAEPAEPAAKAASPKPLKALLIAGGCCHDYEKQTVILSEGIQARANMRVDVVWTRDKSHSPPFPLFDNPDWAAPYDLIIHDECAALQTDPGVLGRILKAHETVPAVHLHCAMHSFRTDEWAKHIGIKSDRHGPHVPVSIEIVDPDHPITKPLKDWVTGKEELYNNVEVHGAEPLALGTQTYQHQGKEKTDTSIVAWTNSKHGAPSFSTSLGHFNHNVEDPRYLTLVTRGALWACGKLDEKPYHTPYTGPNEIKEIDIYGPLTPVKISAQSTQTGNNNHLAHAIDRDLKTRWCANNNDKPTWFQVEFEKPTTLAGAEIEWEQRDEWMQYTIESSLDGKQWTTLHNGAQNNRVGVRRAYFKATPVRFLKINILGQQRDLWPSFWELRLYQPNGYALKLQDLSEIPPEKAAPPKAAPPKAASLYQHKGNIPPRAHRLSPQEEAELLKDVTAPEGFTASLFAPWQMANYPTYLAAAPNGDLYVSSDGNASGGRSPGRGRVVRLRDTDHDGRADEVTEFIREIDSPRGIVWDHDRLYVLHPPHITVYHDPDGDGIADSSQRLISDIAFGFKDRPADHTTNGLEMGLDGWIYIAVGDFGFLKATGTDGRSFQMRGGGVVRFRPDGSGMETFSDGTRNIYGIAITPTLDLFARDNTNDGAGWNVRFHHFTGLEDHGYPRLYKNFADEAVAPLADYGGGSGLGAFYLEEPGIPAEWNKFPYTCDWGRLGSFRHSVQAMGATFKETTAPQLFFKMTRPTDADVDGLSAIYQASWKGPAQFTWGGVDHGYIARMAPTNYTPEPLPDFATLGEAQLVELLRSSPSHVRRLNAQRMLLRRPASPSTTSALLALVKDQSLDLGRRVAALYAISQRGLDSAKSEEVLALILPAVNAGDPLMPFVTRASGDMGIDLRTAGQPGPVPADWLKAQLQADAPRQILEALVAAARQGKTELGPAMAAHLGSADPVLVHTAYRALVSLGTYQAVLPLLDSDEAKTRQAASWALMRMHQPELITVLLDRLSSPQEPAKRRDLIAILARLHHREGPWQGESWSTRPDSRGPYYQLATWEESPRILQALNAVLAEPDLPAAEASFLVATIGNNRIQNDKGLDRILALATQDPSLVPTAIAQIAEKEDLPGKALPLVLQAARSAQSPPSTLQQSIRILLASDHQESFPAIMAALTSLQNNTEASKVRDDTRVMLLASPRLENHTEAFAALLNNPSYSPQTLWSAKALLQLAHGKAVGPEAQEHARQAIDQAWTHNAGKVALLEAAFWTKIPYLNDRILAAMHDPDARVLRSARKAAKRLHIQIPGADKTPRIATLKPEEAIARTTAYKKGNAALGEAIFTRATCMACHTVRQDTPPKGPYLGSIAETYQRLALAEAILLPNKTIAQGFTTNLFTLNDGSAKMGFVTDEAGETVTIRDISSAQHTFAKSEISKRDTLPSSLMPPGLMQNFTVHEVASLLDYLEDLAKKKP